MCHRLTCNLAAPVNTWCRGHLLQPQVEVLLGWRCAHTSFGNHSGPHDAWLSIQPCAVHNLETIAPVRIRGFRYAFAYPRRPTV